MANPLYSSLDQKRGPGRSVIIDLGRHLYGAIDVKPQFACPPPRIVIGSSSSQADECRNCLRLLPLDLAHYGVGRRTTPSGTSPVVRNRHSAMSSLRASATIEAAKCRDAPRRPSSG